MTAISTSTSSKHINDITECPVCNEIFTDPRILPCIHTFCLECLVKWAEDKATGNRLACPLCAKEVRISGIFGAGGAEKVADLPKNLFVQKLLDARNLSNALSAAETMCDICSDCDASADGDAIGPAAVHTAAVYCTECCQNICEQCCLYHQKMKTTSGHKIIKHQDRMQDGELLIDLPENTCDKHSDETQRLFCLDCKLPTCIKCLASNHRSHNCSDVAVVANEMRRQMEGDMKSIVDKADSCRQILSQLENESQSDFSRKIDETAKLVIETADKMKQTIDDYKVKLLKELELARMQHEKKAENVRHELETSMMMLDIFKQYLEQLKSKGTPCDIALAASSLHNRAEELLKNRLHSVGNSSSMVNVKFTPQFSVDQIQSYFDMNLLTSDLIGIIHGKTEQDVTGITTLGDEVFVIRQQAKNIEVYGAELLKLKRLLSLGCLVPNQSSLAACGRNECIYMSICCPSKICRIGLTGSEITTWTPARAPRGISINSDGHLLVACCDANRIQEFTTDGRLIREIMLQTGGSSPLRTIHVIQLPNDQFGITYRGSLHGFAVVDGHGRCIRSYESSDATGGGQIFMPGGLSMKESENVFIAENTRVLLLNLATFCVRQLDVPLPRQNKLKLPYCVYYDQIFRRLYIGEHGAACRVLVVAV